jgi:hypothetical protein
VRVSCEPAFCYHFHWYTRLLVSKPAGQQGCWYLAVQGTVWLASEQAYIRWLQGVFVESIRHSLLDAAVMVHLRCMCLLEVHCVSGNLTSR